MWAFDTGPANSLIDAAVEMATDGRHRYDRDGRLAARGTVDEALLDDLLRHPYFAAEPPKSTGREEFGRPFVERLVQAMRPEGDQDWMDLVATLTELTARTVADAYARWVVPRGVDEVVLSGGGARNPVLSGRIRTLLDPLPVVDGSALGRGPRRQGGGGVRGAGVGAPARHSGQRPRRHGRGRSAGAGLAHPRRLIHISRVPYDAADPHPLPLSAWPAAPWRWRAWRRWADAR